MALKTILIAEDEDDLSGIWEEKLKGNGYRTLACKKVSEATMKLNNQKFDAVLLDMRLEQGSGETLVNLMRDNKKHVNFKTPILVVSGNLDPDLVKRIKDKVNGFMVKPFNTDDLVKKVAQIAPIGAA